MCLVLFFDFYFQPPTVETGRFGPGTGPGSAKAQRGEEGASARWMASVGFCGDRTAFFFLDLDRSWDKCQIAFAGLSRVLSMGLGPLVSHFDVGCWIGQVCRSRGQIRSAGLSCGELIWKLAHRRPLIGEALARLAMIGEVNCNLELPGCFPPPGSIRQRRLACKFPSSLDPPLSVSLSLMLCLRTHVQTDDEKEQKPQLTKGLVWPISRTMSQSSLQDAARRCNTAATGCKKSMVDEGHPALGSLETDDDARHVRRKEPIPWQPSR